MIRGKRFAWNWLFGLTRGLPIQVNGRATAKVALTDLDAMVASFQGHRAFGAKTVLRTRVGDDRLAIDPEPSDVIHIHHESIFAGGGNDKVAGPSNDRRKRHRAQTCHIIEGNRAIDPDDMWRRYCGSLTDKVLAKQPIDRDELQRSANPFNERKHEHRANPDRDSHRTASS